MTPIIFITWLYRQSTAFNLQIAFCLCINVLNLYNIKPLVWAKEYFYHDSWLMIPTSIFRNSHAGCLLSNTSHLNNWDLHRDRDPDRKTFAWDHCTVNPQASRRITTSICSSHWLRNVTPSCKETSLLKTLWSKNRFQDIWAEPNRGLIWKWRNARIGCSWKTWWLIKKCKI